MFRQYIRPALLSFLVLTIITGFIYPLFVTWICANNHGAGCNIGDWYKVTLL